MKKILLIIFVTLFMSAAAQAEAAILYFSSEKNTVNTQTEFYVDILVDTDEDYINAAQSVVSFPPNLLEVVSVDRVNSVFDFWVEEPVFSNEDGTVSFIGGTTRGLEGEDLRIVRINFKTLNSGLAEIRISKPIVTANDGKGTNVLNTVKNLSITIGEGTVPVEGVSKPQVIEQPEIIVREAVISKELPIKPDLSIPLYADQERWYTYQGETVVFWDVPDDVIKIAVSVNNKPKTEPQEAEEELFTGKNLGILDEGVHYIHVQFKNNKGWGAVAHYKISIDVTSPIAFDIKTPSLVSDNPTPEMSWIGSDSLSGYSHSMVSVDGQNPYELASTTITLKPQKPGKHTIRVDVFDEAGNHIDNELEFEILPLEMPTIDFITDDITLEDTFHASGKGIAGEFVDYLISKKEEEVYSGVAEVDISGKWEVTIDDGLDKGRYKLIFTSRDNRGAVSYSTEEITLRVGAKNILSAGPIDLTLLEILMLLAFLIIVGGGGSYWYYNENEKKKYAYRVVINRDIQKISDILAKNLDELELLLSTQKRVPKDFQLRSKTIYASMRKTVVNIKKYINVDKYIQ
ncbi:hypothetical protein ACFLY0_02335 [Patescibacteria group bacterium]